MVVAAAAATLGEHVAASQNSSTSWLPLTSKPKTMMITTQIQLKGLS
jgi:hypothetical protein